MRVKVEWLYTGNGEESLGFTRVLYAYLHYDSNEILYLGKADYCTVQERLRGSHKKAIFTAIAKEERVTTLHAIVGVLSIPNGARFSSELLSDVESLLIIELQPRYNRQSRRSRIARPGLSIKCEGEWPLRKRLFHDE